jgi:DNA-binding XRE family transcriptional regulator
MPVTKEIPDREAMRSYLLSMSYGEWGPTEVTIAREVLGYTQEDLANAVGYTRQGIGRIEAEGPSRVFELAVRYLLVIDVERIPTKNLRVPLLEGEADLLSTGVIPVLMIEPTGSIRKVAWVYERSQVPIFTGPGPAGRPAPAETREELVDLVGADGVAKRTRAFVIVPTWI